MRMSKDGASVRAACGAGYIGLSARAAELRLAVRMVSVGRGKQGETPANAGICIDIMLPLEPLRKYLYLPPLHSALICRCPSEGLAALDPA
jgi:hypothetical protein